MDNTTLIDLDEYDADLINPPSGCYPFVEWEDLLPNEQMTVVVKTLRKTFKTPHVHQVLGLVSTLTEAGEARSLQSVVQHVAGFIVAEAEALAYQHKERLEFLKNNPASGHLGRVPSGWLDAMPRDLERAKAKIDVYGQAALRKGTSSQPIPMGVMTGHDGRPIKGGQVVFGVTVSGPVARTDDKGVTVYDYEWVEF